MFSNCSSLEYIKCNAVENINLNNSYDWVFRVKQTGTFVGNPESIWVIGKNGIPENWTTNVNLIPKYESSNTIGMYIDDFPDATINDSRITYNGETYYMWTRDDGQYDIVKYALTPTINYQELYSKSLEANINNLTYQRPISYFFDDSKDVYSDCSDQTLIKVEDYYDYMVMYVDDFLKVNPSDFVDDPVGNECNAYEYTGDSISYDGDDYYLWRNMGYMSSNSVSQKCYALTSTIDQQILNQKSLSYSTNNLLEDPITIFLGSDGNEYESGKKYNIVSVGYTTGLEIWIDQEFDYGWEEGGYSDMEEYLDWYLGNVDSGGGKHYYYIDEFEYDGNNNYIWCCYLDDTYLVTDTNNVNTLTSYSIESDYSNVNTHPIITFLNKDLNEYGSGRIASNYSIVKVTNSQPKQMMFVDDFLVSDVNCENIQDFIDDPESMGANKYIYYKNDIVDIGGNELNIDEPGSVGANYYEYCEPFEYNGDTYYIWVYSYDGYNDSSFDHCETYKYILTDTIDIQTLYNKSLEASMLNINTYPIIAYLSEDLNIKYLTENKEDCIVKVFEL
jgi:hypothetical protein